MNPSIPIFANPGQTVSLVSQVVDGYGARVDGYVPQVTSVLMPDQTVASGFPLSMTRLDTGLYAAQIQIPSGSSSVGTFIASVLYTDPSTGGPVWQVYQITVALPFGNASFTPL